MVRLFTTLLMVKYPTVIEYFDLKEKKQSLPLRVSIKTHAVTNKLSDVVILLKVKDYCK